MRALRTMVKEQLWQNLNRIPHLMTKNGKTLRHFPVQVVPRERKSLFANQNVPSKKRATGSDSEKWNGAEDSGKKPIWKTGMSKLEVTDNIRPFEPPKTWHQETWFLNRDLSVNLLAIAKKRAMWANFRIRVMVGKIANKYKKCYYYKQCYVQKNWLIKRLIFLIGTKMITTKTTIVQVLELLNDGREGKVVISQEYCYTN